MIAKAKAAGADVVLVKPINPNSLITAITKQPQLIISCFAFFMVCATP
jgi:AmiR/NasT family two-component response regulator